MPQRGNPPKTARWILNGQFDCSRYSLPALIDLSVSYRDVGPSPVQRSSLTVTIFCFFDWILIRPPTIYVVVERIQIIISIHFDHIFRRIYVWYDFFNLIFKRNAHAGVYIILYYFLFIPGRYCSSPCYLWLFVKHQRTPKYNNIIK